MQKKQKQNSDLNATSNRSPCKWKESQMQMDSPFSIAEKFGFSVGVKADTVAYDYKTQEMQYQQIQIWFVLLPRISRRKTCLSCYARLLAPALVSRLSVSQQVCHWLR